MPIIQVVSFECFHNFAGQLLGARFAVASVAAFAPPRGSGEDCQSDITGEPCNFFQTVGFGVLINTHSLVSFTQLASRFSLALAEREHTASNKLTSAMVTTMPFVL
jgi:hypothetical protein